jgi:hypothetical protein
MTEDNRQPLPSTQISKPVPGEEACNADNQIRTIGCNRLEKGVWSRWHMAVDQDFPTLVQDANVHGPGMQVDPAVKLMLFGVESHEVSSSLERDVSHSQHTTGVC